MMTIKNKILAILLAVSFNAFAATSEPSKTSIDGRQYYEIGSPEELAWFGNKVNSGDTAISAILTADIDLGSRNWTPIGKDTTCAFDGIFDGDGHSVSGISVSNKKYAGLFGVLDLGTIKNLTIENSAIRGYYRGEDEYGNYSYGYVGGAVGYAKEKSTIRNAINRASHIAATNRPKQGQTYHFYMGGVVGYTKGDVVNCTNEADISVSDDKGNTGGIAGYAGGNKLDSLKNTGVIKGVKYTGGIVGSGRRIFNAVNNGIVEGRHLVGGICGTCDVSNSTNKGLVKGTGIYSDSSRVGGISGSGRVDSSQNYGNIEVGGSPRSAYVGGISGESEHVGFSLNYGNISAIIDSSLYVGGILGFANCSFYWDDVGVRYSGNLGKVSATTRKSKAAHVGGVAGEVDNCDLSNIFNQGELYSSHYAAGIATVLPQNTITIKNFYVATDTIDAPNAAAFVNYNSTTATLEKGYFDGALLENMPLVGENLGIGKDLFVVDTKILQSDSLAYVLELGNCGGVRNNCNTKGHWSREDEYPIFADSMHKPISQVVFISHKKCSLSSCELDSNNRYTNYKGLINSFPELTDGVWTLLSQMYITRNTPSLDKNFVFGWQDSLVVASYQNCDDLASTDMGCCMNYMLDIKEEYADAYNRYFDKYEQLYGNYPNYYTHVTKDSVNMYFCQDSNNNGVIDWNDANSPSSYAYSQYNSMKKNIEIYNEAYNQLLSSSSIAGVSNSSSSSENNQKTVKRKDDLPNCNSKRFEDIYYVEEEDADYKCVDYKWVNLSNPQAISNINLATLPKVFAKEHSIQIEQMNGHERIIVLDVQGRIVKNVSGSSSMNVFIPYAGRYFVMIEKSVIAIDIK